MANARKKRTARGRKQDRVCLAGGQRFKVQCETKKKRRCSTAVEKPVNRVGNSRWRVEGALDRDKK